MSKRNFSILLVVSALVALAVFFIPSRTGQDAGIEHAAFLPELAAVVNNLDQVRVHSQGGTEVVTLERRDGGWVVQESHDYPADWGVLRPLLADLSQAEVVEEKTSNPEYYDRLGVEDPLQDEAESRLIEFPGRDALPAVIVGNRAQGREGQYLRRQDEARSVLVDRTITLPLNASGWLAGEIIDISDDRVLSARITHADTEAVEIHRESTEVTDFTLANRPEGRETRSAWTVNQLASVLSSLTLDAVAPADDVDWDEAIEYRLKTDDGLQVTAWFAEDEEHRW
ncbi:MAG: DUF4340 domain-containing protein, partial [Xanthomonadales bacterium]|nr:DUF4340 domain-containing protein [Xanthomonadales bacterium]